MKARLVIVLLSDLLDVHKKLGQLQKSTEQELDKELVFNGKPQFLMEVLQLLDTLYPWLEIISLILLSIMVVNCKLYSTTSFQVRNTLTMLEPPI